MAHVKDISRVTRHVSFTKEENELLCRRAAEVGMSVVPFIKREALYGKAHGFSLSVISQHTESIDNVIRCVREVLSRAHPDRLLYQADLELISDRLQTLIDTEKAVLVEFQCILK